MRMLLSEENLEVSIPELYGEVSESISLDMLENSLSEVYIGIFIGNEFYRLRRSYEGMDFDEISDGISEDVLDYFADLRESLDCGDDEITVDSIVVIVE